MLKILSRREECGVPNLTFTLSLPKGNSVYYPVFYERNSLSFMKTCLQILLWSTESLVPYLPSNLLFLKKSKASCSLHLKQKERGSTHKCLPLPLKRNSGVLAHLSILPEVPDLTSFLCPCSEWFQVFPYFGKDDI